MNMWTGSPVRGTQVDSGTAPNVLGPGPSSPGAYPSYLRSSPGRRQSKVAAYQTASMRAMILLTTFSVIPIFVMAILLQPIVVDYGVPLWTLGLFSGVQMAVSSAGAWSASAVGRRLGLRRMMQTMAMLAALSLFGGASGGFRTRRGLEKTLFQATIGLIVLFVLISLVSVRFG